MFKLPEPHVLGNHEQNSYNVGLLTMPTSGLYVVEEVLDDYSIVTGGCLTEDGFELFPDEIFLDSDLLVIPAGKPEVN